MDGLLTRRETPFSHEQGKRVKTFRGADGGTFRTPRRNAFHLLGIAARTDHISLLTDLSRRSLGVGGSLGNQGHGRGCGVGRSLGPGAGRGVGVGRIVAVGEGVGVALGDGVGVGVLPGWSGARTVT
jgi:hypothetical protein